MGSGRAGKWPVEPPQEENASSSYPVETLRLEEVSIYFVELPPASCSPPVDAACKQTKYVNSGSLPSGALDTYCLFDNDNSLSLSKKKKTMSVHHVLQNQNFFLDFLGTLNITIF